MPEHGLRHLPAEARQLRLQPGGAGRLHVRPCDLQRLHVQRGLLRADGQGHQPVPAREGGEDVVAARRHPRLQDDRRHHAGAQPVHGRVLPGDPPGGPLHARDVLPLRRPPHAPVDDHAGRRQRGHHAPDVHGLLRAAHALHGLLQAHRADARRHLRLLPPGAARLRHGRLPEDGPRVLGRVRRPGRPELRLQGHDGVGPDPADHAGPGLRRRADHDRPGRDQPRDPDPAGVELLRRLDQRGDVRHPRPARQPGRQAPPVEQGDAAQAAGARLRRQVLVGRVAAHVRQAQRHATSRATPAAARSPASG